MDNFRPWFRPRWLAVCCCDWLCLVFTSPLVGLCPHCRSCDQDRMCFSIALYHLKSYNDIYTDWSLYQKFVAKISAQTNNIKKKEIKKKKHTDTHTQAPELLLYMPACIHQHVDTHIHANTYSVCVSLWDTLYIDTHYMFGSKIYKKKKETDCAFNC